MPEGTGTLAILGGQPVRKAALPYGHQSIDETDILAVVDVLRSEWLTTGPKVEEFEEAFAAWVGARHAVSFSSGTAALHGTSFAAGLGPNDEAITSPLTFCATANCVLYQGARPVFADTTLDTLNLNPEEVARRLSTRTKAIFPVDYAGHPADLDCILELASQRGSVVIEDACHALGAEYKGRRVGVQSHMSVFSMHPVKQITTGEGGMVTTDNPKLAAKLKIFRNHGITSGARERSAQGQWYYEMVHLGYNYRLDDIACALGLSQLKRLDANLARRRAIAARYNAAFKNMPAVLCPSVRPEVIPAWHLYPIRLQLERLRAGRADIFRALRAENLGVSVHYVPVHLHPYYQKLFGHKPGDYPVTEAAYERLISLPLFHGMSDQDAGDVIQGVSKVLCYYAQ
jgi:perosamine synthetase